MLKINLLQKVSSRYSLQWQELTSWIIIEPEVTNGMVKYSCHSEMGIYVWQEITEISIFFPDDPGMNCDLGYFLMNVNASMKNFLLSLSESVPL